MTTNEAIVVVVEALTVITHRQAARRIRAKSTVAGTPLGSSGNNGRRTMEQWKRKHLTKEVAVWVRLGPTRVRLLFFFSVFILWGLSDICRNNVMCSPVYSACQYMNTIIIMEVA